MKFRRIKKFCRPGPGQLRLLSKDIRLGYAAKGRLALHHLQLFGLRRHDLLIGPYLSAQGGISGCGGHDVGGEGQMCAFKQKALVADLRL